MFDADVIVNINDEMIGTFRVESHGGSVHVELSTESKNRLINSEGPLELEATFIPSKTVSTGIVPWSDVNELFEFNNEVKNRNVEINDVDFCNIQRVSSTIYRPFVVSYCYPSDQDRASIAAQPFESLIVQVR